MSQEIPARHNGCIHEVVIHHSIPTLTDGVYEEWWQCDECEQQFAPIIDDTKGKG